MGNHSRSEERLNRSFINYLQRDDLIESNCKGFCKRMKKPFAAWESHSKLSFEEFDSLCKEEPERVFNLVYHFFSDSSLLMTIFTLGAKGSKNKENRAPLMTIECLAIGYEIAFMLRLPAHLLSGKRAPYESLDKIPTILKHFRKFGFSHQDAENMRKIRNAKDHRLRFANDYIILEDSTKISLNDCEVLLDKFLEITSWWMTSIVWYLFYNPRFLIIFTTSLVKVHQEHKDEIAAHVEGIKIFFADVIQEAEQKSKEKKRDTKYFNRFIRRIKKDAYILKSIVHIINPSGISRRDEFIVENINFINRRILYYSEKLSSEIKDIANKTLDHEDRERFNKGAFFMDMIHNKWSVFIKEIERSPEAYIKRYKASLRKGIRKNKTNPVLSKK